VIALTSVATEWLNTLVGLYRLVQEVTPLDDRESVPYSTILVTKVKYPSFDNLALSDQRDLIAACFLAVDRYNAADVPAHRTPYLLKEARGLRLAEHDAIINVIAEIDAELRAARDRESAVQAPLEQHAGLVPVSAGYTVHPAHNLA
jgi:hypothetical protein